MFFFLSPGCKSGFLVAAKQCKHKKIQSNNGNLHKTQIFFKLVII